MCFYVDPNHCKELIATEDIFCYKIINTVLKRGKPVLVSNYQRFEYKLGKKYSIRKLKLVNENAIFEGFHSYIKDKKFMWCLYECIIPKGAKYYKNINNNEYVSNKIIIIKEL